jgi:hypothetical protein
MATDNERMAMTARRECYMCGATIPNGEAHYFPAIHVLACIGPCADFILRRKVKSLSAWVDAMDACQQVQ